jgi:flagellar hook-basal body complex protein FliE
MAVNFSNALKAYQTAVNNVAEAGSKIAPSSPTSSSGASFANVLEDVIGSTEQVLQQSETSSIKAIAGDIDIQTMVQDITNAELVLDAIISVRDKAIAAYQQITNMQI